MNNRFKFRAYNKELRKMYEVDTICPYEDNHTKGGEVFLKGIQYNSFYFPEEVEVMQCTGLKDKNGKLIYEGDQIRFSLYLDEPDWEYDEIVWGDKDKYPAFDLANNQFDCNGLSYIFNEGWTIEVIGNIYENKELLNDTKPI